MISWGITLPSIYWDHNNPRTGTHEKNQPLVGGFNHLEEYE